MADLTDAERSERFCRMSAQWHLSRGNEKRDAGDTVAGAAYIQESRDLTDAANVIADLLTKLRPPTVAEVDAMIEWLCRDKVIGGIPWKAADMFRALSAELDRTRAPVSARLFDQIGADRLADEVAALVVRHVIDSRSAAADALLDYRNPPRTPRSDRIAELEAELDAAQAAVAGLRKGVPYRQFCRHPDKCAGLGCCPRDPTCAD